MNFDTWKSNLNKKNSYYFPHESKVKEYIETEEHFKAIEESRFHWQEETNLVLFCSKPFLFHLEEVLKPFNVDVYLVAEKIDYGEEYHLDIHLRKNSFSFCFQFRTYEFEEDDFNFDISGKYATLNLSLSNMSSFDELDAEQSTLIRKLFPPLHEAILKKSTFSIMYEASLFEIENDDDLQYFLDETPFEKRHLLEVELADFLQIVRNRYHQNLNQHHINIDNVIDYMTEGLSYEKRSVGYKNPIYDTAYIWALLLENKQAPYQDELTRNNTFLYLKKGLDAAFQKMNSIQKEQLRTLNVIQEISFESFHQ